MANALVLSAGGIAGAFQAGALSVLLQRPEYEPTAIFGSSAGALNGAYLADRAGRSGATVDWATIGAGLVDFWRGITCPEMLWKEGRNFGDGWRGLYQTAAYPPGPGPGNPPLFWDIVDQQIKANNLRAAAAREVHYTAGAVDLFNGDIVYPPVRDEHIIDYIIASTAIPILFDSKDIPTDNQTHSFVDGGTRDVAPVSHAVRAGNYDNIACIICQSRALKRLGSDFKPRELEKLMFRTVSIVINETVNNDLLAIDLIKGALTEESLRSAVQKGDSRAEILRRYHGLRRVTVVRPEEELEADNFCFTKHDIDDMIQKGVETADDLLKRKREFSSVTEVWRHSDPPGSFSVCWDKK